MQENGAAPGSAEPSLDELRRIFEEKGRTEAEEQKRLSRKGTKILLGVPLVLLVAFLCLPNKHRPPAPASDSELAAKATEIQRQLANPGAGGELGGSAGTTEADSHRGDLRFAMDLLRYVNPEIDPAKPVQATPAAPNGK